MQTETIHEFALRALIAAGHVSQAKVDQALEIAGGFQRRATQPPAVGVDVSEEMVERLVDDIPRQRELARRLIASGPKAAHVSCSETHEISEFVDDACDYIERVTAALRTGGGES